MIKSLLLLSITICHLSILNGQVQRDLDKSVPLFLTYENNSASLNWINDNAASTYTIRTMDQNFSNLSVTETVDGSILSYDLGELTPGQLYNYQIEKDQDGKGIISAGIELPIVHNRGRCLIAIENILSDPLRIEIERLMSDIEMDGWIVDTLSVDRSVAPQEVKLLFQDWYNANNQNSTESKTILLLGHVPVPYSGNSAYDGHGNHEGAWVADCYYGDMDGVWTDTEVDNITPSRAANKNIPGDGKFDQSRIPSLIDAEVGRVDFFDLPAFDLDEIELTRQYLDKNHRFRTGALDYPRRAFVDNNFASFAEGFGQTGWKSFPTLFTADSVSIQNYDVLIDNKYLCSYGCGAGSYTSAGGIGNTQDVWVDRDNQTIFTFMFGSYFGDWDITNNFLRSALASGDVLTNAWAGRPTWHVFPMALGKHIGYSTRLTQNASDETFGQGFAFQTAHISLLGDPTLRLHAVQPIADIGMNVINGDIQLTWEQCPDATDGYVLYRKIDDETSWTILEEFYNSNMYVDSCHISNAEYTYMVKAIKLEKTGSGTYYNTSQGMTTSMLLPDNNSLMTFYMDADRDGYGDQNVTTLSCSLTSGFVTNSDDCDDSNADVNLDQVEVPYNNIDDDCNAATLDDDLDQDGFIAADECDDNNPDINPDRTEEPYNGIDDDCDPDTFDDDLDQDGFLIADDCDDNNPDINPDAEDIPNNDIDEDCDGMDFLSATHEIANTTINIYPNPATEIININVEGQLDYKVHLYDLKGQLMTILNNKSQIDITSIPNGIYLLEIQDINSAQKIIERIVISR
ncbi:MopE-related protein [Saprospiraceae bacterium]|nr:MopE-related protein [Saprospiraceae bacterium]